MTQLRRIGFLIAAFATAIVVGANAGAAEFFKGNQVTLLVGSAVGGANDAYARMLARHIGHHLPGKPNVISRNVPGAGGVILAAQMAATAPRDGSVFGQLQRTMLLDPLLLGKNFKFDLLKFNWLGSMNSRDQCFDRFRPEQDKNRR